MNSLVTLCCPLAFGAFILTLTSFLSFSDVQNIVETGKSETTFIKSRAMANLPKPHHTHTRFLKTGEQTLMFPRGGMTS